MWVISPLSPFESGLATLVSAIRREAGRLASSDYTDREARNDGRKM